MQLRDKLRYISACLSQQSSKGQIYRLILFLFLYGLCRFPQMLVDASILGKTLLPYLHEQLSLLIVRVSCFLWHFTYPDIHASADHVIYIGKAAPIQLLPGCTGLNPMIRLTFILLLYPLNWQKKMVMWPISIGILVFASILHFFLLIPASYHYPEWFGIAHNWITRIIFYGFYFCCWILWEKTREFRQTKDHTETVTPGIHNNTISR